MPVKLAMQILEQYINNSQELASNSRFSSGHLMSLIQLCLKSTYFVFDDTIYHQHEGTPMGSPISGLIAELVMQRFEELALHGEPLPRLWLRCVDDTFMIIKKADVDRFLRKINSTWPAMQFTCEGEQAGSLPFLDVNLSRETHRCTVNPPTLTMFWTTEVAIPPVTKEVVLAALLTM